MARGQLIGESLRVGASFRGVPMRLLGVTRVEPPVERLDPSQPRTWTFIGFEIDDDDAGPLADVLCEVLEPGPWYASYSTAEEIWVVFAGARVHYRHGDGAARSAARELGRQRGVPEPQLDWD